MVAKKVKYINVPLSALFVAPQPTNKKMMLCKNLSIHECERGRSCVFIHEEETELMQQLKQKRSPQRDHNINNSKTRLCKYLNKCRRGTKCGYAHSEAELVKPQCRYGLRCKNMDSCKFDHPPKPEAKAEPVVVQEVPNFTEEAFPTTIVAEYVEPELDYSILQQEDRVMPKREAGTVYIKAYDVVEADKQYKLMDGLNITKYIFE